ncbi:MAG: response regulator [Planctomycetaceae bacterium]|nr:response regulator [Planctomycetaceae bacterium]
MSQDSLTTGVRLQTCLIVDDNELLRNRLAEAIAERGFRTRTARNYDEAVRAVREEPPELSVIDLKMPGKSGLELVRAIKDLSPETKCVVCTGFGSIANAVEAIHAGAVNYVTKPADADEILAAFRKSEEPDRAVAETDYQPVTLAEAEWEYIQQVLTDCNGNISKAARLLGIERRTLQRKLKKMRP